MVLYLLALIMRRKGNWSHEGSTPSETTNYSPTSITSDVGVVFGYRQKPKIGASFLSF